MILSALNNLRNKAKQERKKKERKRIPNLAIIFFLGCLHFFLYGSYIDFKTIKHNLIYEL